MKLKTILFMFELEHVYFELCQYTHGVSEKFKYFVTFYKIVLGCPESSCRLWRKIEMQKI